MGGVTGGAIDRPRRSSARGYRDRYARWAVASLATLACFSADAADEPLACGEPGDSVAVARIQPASIDPATWDAHQGWEIDVRFVLRDDGSPDIRYTRLVHLINGTGAPAPDRDVLKQIAVKAFEGYRFCPALHMKSTDVWTATIAFLPGNGGAYYAQMLRPNYRWREGMNQHFSDVVVRVRISVDGMPHDAAVVQSSGDAVADRRALDSSSHEVILTKDGGPLPREMVFQQPYSFR